MSGVHPAGAAYLGTADTPSGAFDFAVNGAGAVIYGRFSEGDYPVAMEHDLRTRGFYLEENCEATRDVAVRVGEYTAGKRRDLDFAVAPHGTEWQLAVWRALREIPFGETRTYSELAAMVGRPGAARAAGRANGANRIPLVIPCHRVIGANGSLTGFAGGVHLKERLLAHERGLVVTTEDSLCGDAPCGDAPCGDAL